MDKQRLNALVEEYINGKRNQIDLKSFTAETSIDQFMLNTVKRLITTYKLYNVRNCGINDLLIALRNYLLTFQVQITIDGLSIPKENDFGIVQDSLNGKYFASYQFPDYINSNFAKAAFLSNVTPMPINSRGYNLSTDPLIYKITGFHHFKSLAQKLAVYGALNTPDGYTTLVSMPTGGGKSLITQTISYQKDGLTIIIVPTISLAIDQVRVAKQIVKSDNISNEVFSYDSSVNAGPIIKAIQAKTARMLFISPEALLNNPQFTNAIKEANEARYLRNIIIDEAHIVVDWGASFRVDYQCLESWRKKLLFSNPSIRTILLSATFEKSCTSILKDFFSHDGKWIEVRCDSLRHEPRYMLVKAKSYLDKNRKMMELVHKMPHPMIVYVSRPAEASEIASMLATSGIKNVKTFTGLTSGEKRRELIDKWTDDQFEIMVATSAFGVGVDKSDVRTVIHMYIPQNANAYYQELGRGGRDQLPCLSIMCIEPDDVNASFGRISKKVMTSEKIVGRWNSMYNSDQSRRFGKLNYIDTSIKPNYAENDEFDDSPTSDADMNWNIYVILFLRRYNLIKVHEVIPQSNKYIFVVEIIEEELRTTGALQAQLIDGFRAIEWNYYLDSFHAMQSAIKQGDKVCWSEMFYDTYDKVSEYCAGCGAHAEPIEGDIVDFALKAKLDYPLKSFAKDQLAFFGGSNNVVCFADENEKLALFDSISEYRPSVYVSNDVSESTMYISNSSRQTNVMFISVKALRDLVKKKGYYYISGVVIVSYSGTSEAIYDLLKFIQSNLEKRSDIKLIHILKENVVFDWLEKSFTDLVDGSVIPAKSIIPEGGRHV